MRCLNIYGSTECISCFCNRIFYIKLPTYFRGTFPFVELPEKITMCSNSYTQTGIRGCFRYSHRYYFTRCSVQAGALPVFLLPLGVCAFFPPTRSIRPDFHSFLYTFCFNIDRSRKCLCGRMSFDLIHWEVSLAPNLSRQYCPVQFLIAR